ncbi:hypothetical protein N7509_012823 [Penicillium cosmopolitanum]|uniref:Uncharacterized protein n=1 Tax=Penicillium cosmopolitanum TaxID=1131564 RepID=A0A9W9SC42_9EURO|nr:uncharacterized protein N7509_012823 [Penicillium cosmopolitanum]KAJ5375937.1 hypothetical protein N7509_012823 [Penicillium cosmopolitanum]
MPGQGQPEEEGPSQAHHCSHQHKLMDVEPQIKTMHASCVHGDTQPRHSQNQSQGQSPSHFEMEGDLIDLDD